MGPNGSRSSFDRLCQHQRFKDVSKRFGASYQLKIRGSIVSYLILISKRLPVTQRYWRAWEACVQDYQYLRYFIMTCMRDMWSFLQLFQVVFLPGQLLRHSIALIWAFQSACFFGLGGVCIASLCCHEDVFITDR